MMKKIFAFISILGILSLSACHTPKEVASSDTLGVTVQSGKTMKPDTLNVAQLDSVIRVDKLPTFNKWSTTVYKDAENNTGISYKTLYDKTTNTIYTIKILNDSVYVMSKRIVNY